MIKIRKNAACPKCCGILRRIKGDKDIFIRCIACGASYRVTGITDFDEEFECEEVLMYNTSKEV